MAGVVFILDVKRRDGRRFVTSVSNRDEIAAHVAPLDPEVVTVSHWARRGGRIRFPHTTGSEWRLEERYQR